MNEREWWCIRLAITLLAITAILRGCIQGRIITRLDRIEGAIQEGKP